MELHSFIAVATSFGLLLNVQSATATQFNNVTVNTNVGNLTGLREEVTVGGKAYGVSKFLGIPYAEPPVGVRRFRFPQAKAPFKDPKIVQEFGNGCLEEIGGREGSEDCLFLNVYAPDRNNIETLAVMIFIHGGGFTSGTSSDYDPDTFAGYGHVIVVTINYRLSVWGFLSTEDSNSHGNYGLWDQRLAIQWVKDNIESFGGDINRITLFGESAGAASVIYQGMFPGNKGLFQRMIAQSGSAAVYWAGSLNPKTKAEALAAAAGCSNSSTVRMIECLRNLSATKIQSVLKNDENELLGRFFPTVDNVFVPCWPTDVLNSEKNSKVYVPARDTLASFELMTGINAGESGYLLYSLAITDENQESTKQTFNTEMVPYIVQTVYKDRLGANDREVITTAIIDEYTDRDDPNNPVKRTQQFIKMLTDVEFLAPMHRTVDFHISTSSRKAFVYYFNVDPTFHVLPTPPWFKEASHADDLLYLFPYMDPADAPIFDNDEAEVAKQMITLWTNFAKTGDPNLPTSVGFNWPPFAAEERQFLDITRKMSEQSVKTGLGEDKAQFWNTYAETFVTYPNKTCTYDLQVSRASHLQTLPVPVLVLVYAFVITYIRSSIR